eukprot:1159957-Pelagomonas_calceolata.AAC.2
MARAAYARHGFGLCKLNEAGLSIDTAGWHEALKSNLGQGCQLAWEGAARAREVSVAQGSERLVLAL